MLRLAVGLRPLLSRGLLCHPMSTSSNVGALSDLRGSISTICSRFPGRYWQELDEKREYPTAFVQELTKSGFLAVMIPQNYGGAGLGVQEASAVLETINASGASAAACHAQMYIMGTLLKHGSEAQKRQYLPKIASGDLRLQAFAVTEPNSGSDTTKLRTMAVRDGDSYVISGQKVFISRVLQSDLMLLLARTTPLEQVKRKTDGLSLFLVDLRQLVNKGLEVRPIRTLMNHSTNALFFDRARVPATSLIGKEGEGFRYVLDGMNAERILLSSESIGDGIWFTAKSTAYVRERVVFGKPIGANQGVAFPISKAHMAVQAAALMRDKAAALFDKGEPCGAEANMAKDCHGGYGFAAEYDVERKFRETRLYKTAPINQNLVMAYVAEHVLKMPRSY